MCSSQSSLVGISIQVEAMDVVWSTSQEAHYNADIIYLLTELWLRKEFPTLDSKLK